MTSLLDYGGLGLAALVIFLWSRRQRAVDAMQTRAFDRMIDISSETAASLRAIERHLYSLNGGKGGHDNSEDS